MDRTTSRILEQYTDMLDAQAMQQLTEAISRPLPPAIRLNTLKISAHEAVERWQQWYGWPMRPIPFCHEGWQVMQNAEKLSWTVEHRMGFYYIQEAASMLPIAMFRFDDQRSPLVLDMAAAPGGKTTHLISRLNDQGLVIANDSNIQRIPSLQGNLQRWGAISSAVTNYPGERFGGWFPEVFDYVLLDAPCSGEALRAGERHKSRLISTQERNTFHQRQVKLLSSAFQSVRPGGQIVYSTCSLASEEDEAVLDALLALYPQQASIEAVDHLLPIPAAGSTHDGKRDYNDAVRRAVRLWPHLYDTSGFFAALIRKHDTVASQAVPPPKRTLEKTGYKPLTQPEQDTLIANLLDSYGFDLTTIIERQGLTLWKHGQFVSALPEPWLTRFTEFPFASVGMVLGKQSHKGFMPSHELISRFSSSFTQRRITLNDTQTQVWLRGQNVPGGRTPLPSSEQLVLVEDNEHRFLGRGKVDGDELKNLLPKWL